MTRAAMGLQTEVAVLFARKDSVYRSLQGVEVYDRARDARNWPGGCPVVAHPPCAQWGRLRGLSTDDPVLKSHGPWAVERVRMYGGVLEHPAHSTLWTQCGLPRPSEPADACGGWTLGISQQWFGHRAQKNTWLYIVGCARQAVPAIPLVLGEASHTICPCKPKYSPPRPEVSKSNREATPPALAAWLVEVARLCRRGDAP